MQNGMPARSASDRTSVASAIPAWMSRSAPAGWPFRTRATVARRRSSWRAFSSSRGSVSAASHMRPPRSEAAALSVPVLLAVAHERRAQMAVGLLARVGGHVLTEQVERLLPSADRAAVGRGIDQARAGQRGDPRIEGLLD